MRLRVRRGSYGFESVSDDIRLACRGLWRARGFTGAAVFTLALGIAGTTVMFALVLGVLLRPLPVRAQDALIIAWKEPRTSGAVRYPFGNTEIQALARASTLLENVAGVTRNGVGRTAMIDGSATTYVNVAEVTGGFFDVLGVRPALGRALTPADDKDGAENVIVLSNGFWHRQFGGLHEVIGRLVTLDDRSVRVVGVMPADLDYPAGVEVWRTTASVPVDGPFGDAARQEVNLIARLRRGVTVEQARSEIVLLSERLDAERPGIRGLVPVVRPFAEDVVGQVRTTLLALFMAVALVLLIASANVANLLLMRTEARAAEFALRAALGATRSRIVTQILIESLVIAGLAGAAGAALASWALVPLVSLVPDGLPRVESVRIDTIVIGFSILVALAAAFLAALIPSLLPLRADLSSGLKNGAKMTSGSAGISGRGALVVAQVALAVTVIAAAGLLIRSVARLQRVELGLPAERLVLVELQVPQTNLKDRHRHAQFLNDVVARLDAVPVISSVTPVNLAPFSGQGWDVPRITGEGQDAGQAERNPSLNLESIHPNYFATLQVPIVHGRAFIDADRAGVADVAILSQDLAERLWPGENPVGKRLKMGDLAEKSAWYTVVGVAGSTRYRELIRQHPTLYLAAAQFQMTATMLVVRTTASLELVQALARDSIQAVDPGVRVMRVASFGELLGRPLARPTFNAFILAIFGALALALSTIGLYAVMAAYVRQREREIAIRLAVGATAARIRQFVLAETMRLAGLGAIVGAGGAVAASPLLRGLLFDVDPLDPPTIVVAALLLVAAATLASYVPVRRATRVDAATMLRGQ